MTFLLVMCVSYETTLELTESDLEEEFNTWLNDDEIGYFGELRHAEYENNKRVFHMKHSFIVANHFQAVQSL